MLSIWIVVWRYEDGDRVFGVIVGFLEILLLAACVNVRSISGGVRMWAGKYWFVVFTCRWLATSFPRFNHNILSDGAPHRFPCRATSGGES